MCKFKMGTQCRYNPVENTATLTSAFAKRAGIVGTVEYNYLVSLRNANPGLVVLKATHASPTPKTDENGKTKERDPFDKVSYKAMTDYISLCRTKDAYMKEFNNIRLLSKGQPAPYKYVRMWFKAKFPLFGSINVEYDADGFIVERIAVQAEVKTVRNTLVHRNQPVQQEAPEDLDAVA